MTDYLDVDDALVIVDIMGQQVRDIGLLASAVARPRASAFGEDVYRTLAAKGAALIDGVNRNHPLVDGNKRLSWICAVVFAGRNGFDLSADVDDAERVIMLAAGGHLELDQLTNWITENLTTKQT